MVPQLRLELAEIRRRREVTVRRGEGFSDDVRAISGEAKVKLAIPSGSCADRMVARSSPKSAAARRAQCQLRKLKQTRKKERRRGKRKGRGRRRGREKSLKVDDDGGGLALVR